MSDLKRAAHLMWAHYDAVKDTEFPLTHEFLIDDDGRGWCAEDCRGTDGPHWEGELPEERWER